MALGPLNGKRSLVRLGLTLLFSKPFLYPHLFPMGGGVPPPAIFKNLCPYEREILQGIRDPFESLRNVKVGCIVFTWLP